MSWPSIEVQFMAISHLKRRESTIVNQCQTCEMRQFYLASTRNDDGVFMFQFNSCIFMTI